MDAVRSVFSDAAAWLETRGVSPEAVLVAAIVLVVALAALAVWVVLRRRRRERLRERFGAEYDHTVTTTGSRRDASSELAERERRHRDLELTPLDTDQRSQLTERWTSLQRDFVDAPTASLQRADALLQEIMRARGYPPGDVEGQIAYLSVDHGHLVGAWRHLRSVLDRTEMVSTEEQRQVLVSVRTLFDALVRPEDRATPAEQPTLVTSGAPSDASDDRAW